MDELQRLRDAATMAQKEVKEAREQLRTETAARASAEIIVAELKSTTTSHFFSHTSVASRAKLKNATFDKGPSTKKGPKKQPLRTPSKP